MIQAMSTGHDGSMSTVHANGPEEALWRLESMALSGCRACGRGDRAVPAVVGARSDRARGAAQGTPPDRVRSRRSRAMRSKECGRVDRSRPRRGPRCPGAMAGDGRPCACVAHAMGGGSGGGGLGRSFAVDPPAAIDRGGRGCVARRRGSGAARRGFSAALRCAPRRKRRPGSISRGRSGWRLRAPPSRTSRTSCPA